MKFDHYICPFTKSKLNLSSSKKYLSNKNKKKFYINHKTVNFLNSKKLNIDEKNIKKGYDLFAHNYDKWITWMFKSFKENEKKVRNGIIKNLKIKKKLQNSRNWLWYWKGYNFFRKKNKQ